LAGAIQLTEVDFEQIKSNLIDYLKSTKEFTDFDFAGSNLQVILNLISYQAQLNAYSTNMIANESFLASANLRENVVSNARMVGFTPISARSAYTEIDFQFQLDSNDYPNGFPQYIELNPGGGFSTTSGTGNFTFNIIDPIVAAVNNQGLCKFEKIKIYEGIYLTAKFTVNKSNYNQRFLLENRNIDSTTIRVEVQENPNEETTQFYNQAVNLVQVTEDSKVYWLEEVTDMHYELTFGDGYFGKPLLDGSIINVTYVITNANLANGIQGTTNYTFIGRGHDSYGTALTIQPTITAVVAASGGAEIESAPSVKFRAPKSYAAQNRCVISQDYSTLVREIYPAVDDIYVYGGEELDIPQYGRIFVAIKPSTGDKLSALTKNYIKQSLDPFRVASLEIVITDASILNVEVVSAVYYDPKRTLKDNSAVIAAVNETLTSYSTLSTVSKFGGAVRYSRILGAVDDSDPSITRNDTYLRMRKDFTALTNTPASYEICFENALQLDCNRSVVWSTGFTLRIDGVIDSKTYYFEDDRKGNIVLFYLDALNNKVITDKNWGTVNYSTGEIMIGYQKPITFVTTSIANSIIEVRGLPLAQDIVAKQSVYLDLDVATSDINATVDTNIAST